MKELTEVEMLERELIQNPIKFTKDIEKLSSELDMTYIDSIIHYCTENGVVFDADYGDKYYIYYSDDNKEDRYFENLGDAESEILQMQLDKIRKTAHTQFLETLDIYLYCNVCGHKTHTNDIGIVFGSHTCTTCADNMGEKCQELGTQHI